MTDENKPPADDQPTDQAPKEEPKKPSVNLADEVKGAVEAPKPTTKTTDESEKPVFTKDQMEWIEQNVTGPAVSRAINEFSEKKEKEFEQRVQKGDYLTKEQFELELQNYNERVELERKADAKMNKELAKLGIVPDTDDYNAFVTKYEELKEVGAVTAKSLLVPESIEFIARAAKVVKEAPAPKPHVPTDTGSGARPLYPDGFEVNAEDRIRANADAEALKASEEALKRAGIELR